MRTHDYWMQRVLLLARKGQGHVHPNPMVGCILVRNNRAIAQGWHHAFGQPHAELEALTRAKDQAKGATLYVNLEPCAHWGKTPPCVKAIIEAGVKKVVAAMRDPNPLVAGKGFNTLKKAKIDIEVGILEREARSLNRPFLRWISEKRPYITLKAASSLDGRVATAAGHSQWITGPEARRAGHTLRAHADAIAVGVGTVLADNPRLTAHGQGRDPLRVVFDSLLRTPLSAHVAGKGTLFFASHRAPEARQKALLKKGAQVVVLPGRRQPDLPKALEHLGTLGIAHLLVEGGPTLHGSFLDAQVVDQVFWFMAPLLIGGEKALSAIGGHGIQRLTAAHKFLNVDVVRVGADVCFRGLLKD